MAPSDERGAAMIDLPTIDNVIARSNITSAVNYEVKMVDQFLASESKRRQRETNDETEHLCAHSSLGECIVNNSAKIDSRHDVPTVQVEINSSVRLCPYPDHCVSSTDVETNKLINIELSENCTTKAESHGRTPDKMKRRSTRGKGRREVHLSRSRVRYDMKLVPFAKRNKVFLNRFPLWWLNDNDLDKHAQRLASEQPFVEQAVNAPFYDDSSIVWIPSKRMEWEDSINEMTALCTSAAVHRHNVNHTNTSSNVIHPPLSREYIKDRIDIDDPLHGFQIRCRNGGWLQGFILYTNFTTWTHDFKWDSRHPLSGISQSVLDGSEPTKIDFDGSLADELEAEPRAGDPQGTGIVFSGIAEIGLVGALGCGEYLLRMALDSIYGKEEFKFVVLQATEQSKSFYEQFGFVRVGSICRYGKGLLPPEDDTPISGYRHWTHANESEQSLEKHGGPSYMMCLKLPERESTKPCETSRPAFLDEIMKIAVEVKPRIDQLGPTMTPGLKANRRASADSLNSLSHSESFPSRARTIVTRRSANHSRTATNDDEIRTTLYRTVSAEPTLEESHCVDSPLNTANVDLATERSVSKDGKIIDKLKCYKIDDANVTPAVNRKLHDDCVSSPLEGKLSAYYQNQYNSVWLAVPIKPVTMRTRQPPKERKTSIDNHFNQEDENSALCKAGSLDKLSGSALNAENGRFATAKKRSSAKQSDAHSSKRKKTKLAPSPESKDRSYHSVRGPDGKFVRVDTGSEYSPSKKSKSMITTKSSNGNKVSRIDKTTLMKQRVKSYPRSRLHFFNRVVKPKIGPVQYYFVLNFNEEKGMIRIVPMQARGVLSGKREGRPRYQAMIGDTDHNFIDVSANEYDVVNSAMIMKTPVVASEAWDIEDD